MYYSTLEYYKKLFDESSRNCAFYAKSIDEYKAWKKKTAERLREITGINRCIACDTNASLLANEMIANMHAEHWTITTEPGIIMPFFLFRPKNNEGPCPVMIIPHGHGGGKDECVQSMQPFICECLDDGFMVICPDERGCGERREFPQQSDEFKRGNSHRELLQVGIGFGRTVIGTAVWDLMKLVDWIVSLPETSDFIGCAGVSGGGQQTLWLSALDERISAAITSGYFYGMKEALIELPQNCACNYVPFLFETIDMCDLAAMIAPRPLFI